IRELAQAALVEQFGDGRNVALEMLDQLPGVAAGRALSETLGQLTGRLLPSPHSDSWAIDARLGLVEHALDLLGTDSDAVDDKLGAVIRSYSDRRSALGPDSSPATRVRTAREAAAELAESWRRRAVEAPGGSPAPTFDPIAAGVRPGSGIRGDPAGHPRPDGIRRCTRAAGAIRGGGGHSCGVRTP
ncbi:MAG: hypothetical protein ACYTA3_13350, partial [Planctomycetota bacterium]